MSETKPKAMELRDGDLVTVKCPCGDFHAGTVRVTKRGNLSLHPPPPCMPPPPQSDCGHDLIGRYILDPDDEVHMLFRDCTFHRIPDAGT